MTIVAKVPVPALFLASGFTQYYGAALAVGLFAVVPATTVAWLRVVVSAVLLLLWRRPWRRRDKRGARSPWTKRDLLSSAVFGIVLALMNIAFYLALDHLPLGTVVAIEFMGPVAVAALTGRSWRERLGIVFAAGGVVLLAGVTLSDGWSAEVVIGLVASAVAATSWAGYIILGRRIAVKRDGIDSLSVAMAAGAIFFAPAFFSTAGPAFVTPGRTVAVIAIALLSSVIPYVLEQVILKRITAAKFAILLALLPVTAGITGAVALGQLPILSEVLGMLLVSAAIAISSSGGPRRGRAKALGESQQP